MFLDRIVAQTLEDLEQHKQAYTLEEMQHKALAQEPPRDMLEALKSRSRVHLIAEVKRASPSKGMLAPDMDPVEQALMYERNGAAVISVLTEPHFFLGSPAYLTAIKNAVSIPVLRKDFIVDEYQVFEARAWGADAILLICAILDDQQLLHLLTVAHNLRMRCLVEVHSKEEALRAIAAGALIIGVNSRDLTTFEMHPYLIREIRQIIPADHIVVAESGIHTAADARRLARYDVQAMLVGEALVVSKDAPAQIHTLLQNANSSIQIKICGLRSSEQLDSASAAGADMLGFVFYAPSHRFIQPEQVRQLVAASRSFQQSPKGQSAPDLVGLFVNADAEYVNTVAELAGLHFVQLHGSETPEYCQQIKRPVIKALALSSHEDLVQADAYQAVTWRLLLDTPTPGWGGSGKTHDWQLARLAAAKYKLLLAGGLTADNVVDAIRQVRPWGIDVSSGVETNKQKDPEKIRTFIQRVRTCEYPVTIS